MDSHICRVVLIRYSVLTISFLLLRALPPSLSQPPPPPPGGYESVCSKPYKCEGQPELFYPFWGGDDRPAFCGAGRFSDQFHLTCKSEPGYESQHYNSIQMGLQKFEAWDIDNISYTMKMVPLQESSHESDVCSEYFNFALSPVFRYNQTVHTITVISDCHSVVSLIDVNNFTCNGDTTRVVYYVGEKDKALKQNPRLNDCGRIIEMPAEAVQGHRDDAVKTLEEDWGKGFNVSYSVPEEYKCEICMNSTGACGSNDTTHEFTCYCSNGGSSAATDCFGHVPVPVSAAAPAATPSHQSHKWNWKAKVGIAVGAVVFGVVATMAFVFVFHQRRKKTRDGMSYVQPRSMSSDPSSYNKDTEVGSINYGVHLFTYSELEEATNYFDPSKELGEGGFGTVYHGKLRDGRCVAVKRLYENNYRIVEQFKNEIKILTSLHHRNLVSLYGCTSRHSRELLLVYEYIPNGTVADHLHGERSKAGTLPWHIRMNIAVETASALAYLHASEVIHRDVKTNNILLDSHFVVKVADFGLSRLFPTHVTHVSTAPQGTPGYVDPEYHECYQLTVKSDVYSFGVVLVELISSLPAVDITRHRHEINLSNMAINKIHNKVLHELVDPNLGFDSDFKVRKMINAVAELAFRCLQSSKDMRPSMEEVLDTLKDIQSDGKHKSQPEVMDISSADDVVLLKDDPPPPSPDSNVVSKSTTPNASG